MYQQYPLVNGVHCLSPIEEKFEEAYIAVREKEGRVLEDEEVMSLPHLPVQHPRRKEWQKRNHTLRRALPYIAEQKPNHILDLGCGNGWFTNCLAQETGGDVIGVDMNMTELVQAARLFGSDNCHFMYGDIFSNEWPKKYFDLISLNACVQYFPDLGQLLTQLLSLLKPNGTIHLLDSPFYEKEELKDAHERTVRYYQQQGIPEMIPFYHHHIWGDLEKFDSKILYHPHSMINKIRRKLDQSTSPFPWVVIQF